MNKIVPIIVCTLFISNVAFANSKKIEITYLETKDIEQFDWNVISPLDFIDILKKRNAYIVTIWEAPPNNWIKEEHVYDLMKLIESTESAAHVVSSLSSYMPSGPSSTVGNQAIFLIEGFINEKYPPSLWSKYSDIKKVEEIKKWYIDWNQK